MSVSANMAVYCMLSSTFKMRPNLVQLKRVVVTNFGLIAVYHLSNWRASDGASNWKA